MRAAAVAAYGGTRFEAGPGPGGAAPLLLGAARDLFSRFPGADREGVDAVLVATNSDEKYLGAVLAQEAGLAGAGAALTVECMCGSGAAAVAAGAAYVASGMARSVLVAGADEAGGPGRLLAWDASRGSLAGPVYWASLLAAAYKRRSGATDEQLAAVPAKNRRSAADNPLACRAAGGRPPPGVREVMESRRITGDLGLYDCCRPCTGASAVLLAGPEEAAASSDAPALLTGVGQRTASASFAATADPSRMAAAAGAASAALSMSGLPPGRVDVAEVHDAFSACEPMALEAVGMAGPGRGAALCAELHETGDRRVNPRGGLLGAGHPPGATGIAQVAEVAAQLRGAAGRRQVGGARAGLVHNTAAGATSATVLVMEAG